MFVQRLKYYVPWKLSSAAVVLCGLSYKYETPNPMLNNDLNKIVSPHKFDKVVNVILSKVEWEVNPKNRIRVNKNLIIFI